MIDNALKFHVPGKPPEVDIGCEVVGDELHISVRDKGIGIAPEFQERIFEAFQRLHAHAEYEGTGLGLALSRRIAQMHHGRIFVESEPDAGSRFVLALPASCRIGIASHTIPRTEIA
ncbi:MAG: sensor histidine kinase [Pseudomonadota bacterium]